MSSRIVHIVALLVLFHFAVVRAQTAIKKQIKNSDAPVVMTVDQLNALGDPFFKLVLKDNPQTVQLEAVEDLIQPDPKKRHLFVVGEATIDHNPTRHHRAVLTFEGIRDGIALSPNVMISTFFTGNKFPTDESLEAWGWDAERGRYNYYRLDGNGGVLSWKFRGSSDLVHQLSNDVKKETCFACHLSGAPVMKELLLPWNHWHSSKVDLPQLSPIQPPSVRWNVATDPHFIGADNMSGLGKARQLELAIKSSLKEFNLARQSKHVDAAAGTPIARNGKQLLQSLFETTEFNIISSRVESNMHPLSPTAASQPAASVEIPASFFINSALIAGGGQSALTGLGIEEARDFGNTAETSFEPVEYKEHVNTNQLKVDDKLGDANFAWLTPEPSYIDNQLIDSLMKRGIVPSQFVAAVLSIDLRKPLMSPKRQSLLSFIPDEFEIPENAPTDPKAIDFFKTHDLTKKTIANLESAQPAAESIEAEFLQLLKMTDKPPIEALRQLTKDYSAELKAAMSGATTRDQTLKKLFKQLMDLREAVLAHPQLSTLDETAGKRLFPSP